MKITPRLFLLSFAFIFASCAKNANNPNKNLSQNQDSSNVNLTRGLLAYYPFNGNTNDASGNGNNGQLVNTAQIDFDERGFAASALNCHHNGDGMVVPNSGKFNFDTAITVSLNVMLRDYQPSSILNFINYNDQTAQRLSIGNAETGGAGYFTGNAGSVWGTHFALLVADNNDVCGTPAPGDKGPFQSLVAKQTYQLSEHWYNVICTINRTKASIYINGILDNTATLPSSTFTICQNANLLVGCWAKSTPASAINGIVDEVRIYNRVLNNDEIKSLGTTLN
jgi:hypothetical protein